MTNTKSKLHITTRSSYNAGKRAERYRIFRLMQSFSETEDQDIVGEVLSDLHKFIREGKKEYMKNIHGE